MYSYQIMIDGVTARNTAKQVVLGACGIGVVTLLCFPLHVNYAIPGFLCLLTVVLLSRASGFASAAIVSVVAVLSLDYFFTPPIGKLEIASPIDSVTLVTYLITSLIITRLSTEARQKAQSAERRREDLARLYQIVWRLFSAEPQAVSGAAALQICREVLDVETVCLFDGGSGKLESAGAPNQNLVEKTQSACETGCDYQDESSRISVHCLQLAARRTGAVGFQGLRGESMAAPLSMLLGASLERAESFQKARDAAATSQVEVLRAAIVDAFAHQFKTPLAAILTAAGGIREAHGATAQQLEMVEMIEVETMRLSRLATRLLVTARLDRDEVQPRLVPTNLRELIGRMAGQYPTEARHVSMELGTEEVQVASEPELLALALSQLLDNACKYSPAGSPIRVSLAVRDGMAWVRVRNRGSFVPPPERAKIFERFYRGAAAAELTAGTGLGLYVARKIAVAHGGSLDLEEYPAGGLETAFSCRLPLLETRTQNVAKAS